MKFKPTRTDRLTPTEREIVDRFERGQIDAAEAGRLLIDSVHGGHGPAAGTVEEEGAATDETGALLPGETPEEATARALVERIARDVYGDPD